jgi:KDO2-lipid IV(A) lauroyltransferase
MRFGLLNVRKGLLQVVLPLLRLLPPRRSLRLVTKLGQAEYVLNPPLRKRFNSALARGAEHFGCEWNISAEGRALAGNNLRWRARDRLLDGWPNETVAPLFHVQGRDALDSALGEGKGVILLFNHFGAFLMPAHWLVRSGYPLRWFTERPRNISKLVERSFQTDGPLGQRKLFMSRKAGPTEGGAAIRRAVRILEAGMIVQVAGDVRGQGPRTAPARFLGRTYNFTTTWVTLAARTGAPVVPAFGVMADDGSYTIEFLPAFHVPPGSTRPVDMTRCLQAYLALIEDRVRRHPSNSSDYFFWADSPDYQAESA